MAAWSVELLEASRDFYSGGICQEGLVSLEKKSLKQETEWAGWVTSCRFRICVER